MSTGDVKKDRVCVNCYHSPVCSFRRVFDEGVYMPTENTADYYKYRQQLAVHCAAYIEWVDAGVKTNIQ